MERYWLEAEDRTNPTLLLRVDFRVTKWNGERWVEAPGYLYGEMTGMGGVAGFIPIHESQVDDWKARLAGDPVSEKPPDISRSKQGRLSRSTKSGKPTRRPALK